MFKKTEKPTLGGFAPKSGFAGPPEVKVSRSISKAISWRVLGTFDTLVLSFLLITYVGPLFGLEPETSEALEIAGLIAITEVITKMIFYYFHERIWTRIAWGFSKADGKRIIGYRRTVAKTASWRVIASTDTVVLAWLYTGNLATALSIGGLEVFTKLILYFLHERIWTRVPHGTPNGETADYDVSQQQKEAR